MVMMATLQIIFLCLCFFNCVSAVYKQWIPDTNFENVMNWDSGSVPCGNDQVRFPAERRISVYVENSHTVSGMSLPVDGEFILASGAGFSVRDGKDRDCGAGVTTQFRDSDSLKWFDPTLWQAASTADDLENGLLLFSVHEESVPCQFDDVVFRTGSSFRVDISSDQGSVPVKSVSILDKKFSRQSDLTLYLSSHSGQLQFHGSSVLTVGGSGCPDNTGCECGNSANHDHICASVKCPHLECEKPLLPVGHCCDICGAIVTMKYSESFVFKSYRQRLQHLFLSQPKYRSAQLAMSKVSQPQRLLGVIPFGATFEIQVVILDQNTGPDTGKLAEALARDIQTDVKNNGAHLGIEVMEVKTSTSGGSNAGVVVGVVVGVLLLVACVGFIGFLCHRGTLKVPSMPSITIRSKGSELGELGGPLDQGFDNPMFDKPTMLPEVPGLYGKDSLGSITMTQSGVHFVNPVYDETDFNA